MGLVEGRADELVAWGVGGTFDAEGSVIVDPGSDVRFPLVFRWDDGLLTMINEEGFTIEFNGFPLPFKYFRVATTLDAEGNAAHSPWLNAKTICDEIETYGVFLQIGGFCNRDTGLLEAVGGTEFRPFGDGRQTAPTGLGTVQISRSAESVVATLSGTSLRSEEHNFGILILDANTRVPVALNYTARTEQAPASGSGPIETVTLDLTDVAEVPSSLRAYLMVDAYPAAVTTLP